MTHEKIVRDTLLSVLPVGVPPSFASIDRVSTEGRGKALEIIADLTMVDGLPATVRFRRWSLGWSHEFTIMPGGAMSFEDGAWRRVPAAIGGAS